MTRTLARLLALLAILLASAAPAHAHKPSDSYLTLTAHGQRIDAQWDIALRDLDMAIGLDTNNDGQLTWDEVRSHHAAIAAYALPRLTLTAGGQPCAATPTAEQLIDNHTDGAYTVLRFTADCPRSTDALTLDYRLFADLDPQHRGLVRLTRDGAAAANLILGGDHPRESIAPTTNDVASFLTYVKLGIWHIWIGYDHVLFLLSLLLPAVLVWRGHQWEEAHGPRAVALDVIRIVSAFTLAHSVTLTVAALHVVTLPSRWVESAIALSVVLAALNNITPVGGVQRWMAAFGFGLIHGFGFANVLNDLGLPPGALAASLVGFNLGVEMGQLALVAVFLPVAYLMRSTWFYRRVVLVGGSAAIMLVASVWLAERAFNLQLLTA
ncbi:HupE/UreJ family protein [Massilia arenosa]|uniref:HupE/UreJ family protein n=1 Tax=Zemynaea arenosa TaxID=2561931 RepID=A0A4Y9S3W8_9BURK|nr:HupE/UreJ family protein [Massilia arenosa]TFW16061.1 HupE/UreJ family protein [Massilia arenosa]